MQSGHVFFWAAPFREILIPQWDQYFSDFRDQ